VRDESKVAVDYHDATLSSRVGLSQSSCLAEECNEEGQSSCEIAAGLDDMIPQSSGLDSQARSLLAEVCTSCPPSPAGDTPESQILQHASSFA